MDCTYKNIEIKNLMKKYNFLIPVMLMISCTAKSNFDEKIQVIDEAILDVKQTLPKKHNQYTVWKDISRDGQTIKLIYQMDNYIYPKDRIYLLENYAKSDAVKSTICNSLIGVFGQEYSVESITYDMENQILFSFTYSKDNC